jgi:hypothetical protein
MCLHICRCCAAAFCWCSHAGTTGRGTQGCKLNTLYQCCARGGILQSAYGAELRVCQASPHLACCSSCCIRCMHLVTSAHALAKAAWQAPTASCTSCTCACRTSALADSYCDTASAPAPADGEPALLERVLLMPPVLLLLPLPLPLPRPDSVAPGPKGGVRGLLLLLPCWLAADAFGLLLLAPAPSVLRPTGGSLPAGVLLLCCCVSPVMLPQDYRTTHHCCNAHRSVYNCVQRCCKQRP